MKKKHPTILWLLFAVTALIIFYSIIKTFVIYEKYNSAQKQSTENLEVTEVTLRLQWHIQTQFAGYFVALKKGYYDDVNLKVNIKEGGYGKNPLFTVKEGLEEFGTKWMADLATNDSSLISLANIVKDNGLFMVSKKDKNIQSVDDFKGKKVSIWFIGNEYQLFALLDKNNIDQNQLEIISQKWDMSQFYNNEVDVAAVMSYNELLKIYQNGYSPQKLNIFKFKDLGVGFPGQNIFSSKEYYKKNPEICRKFIKASIRGWEFAIKHPEETTRIIMNYDQENILDFDHQLLQMKEIINLIQANKYQIGINLQKDYSFIEELFKKYKIIDQTTTLKNRYTNDFIPKHGDK